MTANASPLPKVGHNGACRRSCLDLRHPTETMIARAEEYVEAMGADPLLTDALAKLLEARDLVGDWLEGGQKPPPPRTSPFTLDEQLAQLRKRYPQATLEKSLRKYGGHLVTIPDFPLVEGYNRASCTVYFVLPDGYPYMAPERFYTSELSLADGRTPYYARPLAGYEDLGGIVPPPPGTMIWFWQVQHWSAMRDTLKTYASVINVRLNQQPRMDPG